MRGRKQRTIGGYTFYGTELSSFLIKRTEADFLANVTTGSNWYDNRLNPTIIYDPN